MNDEKFLIGGFAAHPFDKYNLHTFDGYFEQVNSSMPNCFFSDIVENTGLD
jgi:hypothetical protein